MKSFCISLTFLYQYKSNHRFFFLFFSGAEKRGKRDIHPFQTFPYMGRLNRSFSSLVH